MDMADGLRLTSRVTVARLLERNDFAARYESGAPISLMELLYPLLQGWDSVQVEADVELGGTDQLFNNLMGRHLQEQVGQAPQVVVTTPLLEGIGGGEKMSKSLGNYVGITEPPEEQFGKLMRIPDELMPRYFELTTGWHPDRVDEVLAELERATPADRARLKRLLARTVVDLYHGEGAGAGAEAEFDRVFRDHAAPTDVEDVVVPPDELRDGRIEVARLLTLAGLVASNREGRRKIAEGGVYLADERVTDPGLAVTPADVDGRLLRLGRRSWARIRAGREG
jgi:tyrosyl-tRNA synthetase